MTFIADVPTHIHAIYNFVIHLKHKRKAVQNNLYLPEAVVVIPLSLEVSAARSAELWLVGVGADAGCEFGVVLGGGIGLPSWLSGGVAAGVCDKCGTAELVGGGGWLLIWLGDGGGGPIELAGGPMLPITGTPGAPGGTIALVAPAP